jgi:hypothetical protein
VQAIMNTPLFSLLLILLVSCFTESKSERIDTAVANSIDTTTRHHKEMYTDSTLILFGNYQLKLHIFDTANNYDAQTKNAILTFSRQKGGQTKVFFRDSMFCMYPDMAFTDFNNDKAKDVLVFYYTSARANPTYHLYLTDVNNRRLIRVKGFEDLPNPHLDTTNNVIESIALSGTNYYSFHRINSNNKLINLGHSFYENPTDSTQYEKALRQILKEHK